MRLTDRQAQIAPMVLEALTNKEIGARLDISETAVKYHVRNLYRIFEIPVSVNRRVALVIRLQNLHEPAEQHV